MAHRCELDGKKGQQGEAVELCVEIATPEDVREFGTFDPGPPEIGELWVTNDEYSSQVNFCPVCGYKAPKQIDRAMIDAWHEEQRKLWDNI